MGNSVEKDQTAPITAPIGAVCLGLRCLLLYIIHQ